jgi:hypothetical protein
MADWSEFRPGQFDRAQLGRREPQQPGLFGRSEAQQMPGQGDLFGGADSPGTPDDAALFAASECGESQ